MQACLETQVDNFVEAALAEHERGNVAEAIERALNRLQDEMDEERKRKFQYCMVHDGHRTPYTCKERFETLEEAERAAKEKNRLGHKGFYRACHV
jgi:Arc/MetJ-type ribon-helix-helix transcriptional regulator